MSALSAFEAALALMRIKQIDPEQAVSQGKGRIIYKYRAQNVYLVASSKEGVVVTIKKDGVIQKTITIKEDTLYTIISGTEYGSHTLEIEVPNAGLNAFAFTFG